MKMMKMIVLKMLKMMLHIVGKGEKEEFLYSFSFLIHQVLLSLMVDHNSFLKKPLLALYNSSLNIFLIILFVILYLLITEIPGKSKSVHIF